MGVGAFCNRNVVIARRDESIRTVARRMREFHVGDVVIVEGGTAAEPPVGIVTDRDLAIEVMALDVSPDTVTAGDVMSDTLAKLDEDAELSEATALMRSKAVRRLVIVDRQEALVGILTVDDVLEVLAEEMNDLARLVIHQGEREGRKRMAL